MRIDLFRYEPGSSVSIAAYYGLDGPGIESLWGRDFPPVQTGPWGPSSLLHNGYRVFPEGEGLEAAGEWD